MKHLTLIAAGSAFLAALPLINVFERYTWAVRSFLVLAVMCGVAVLMRSLRAPSWAPTVAMAVSGLFTLTWLFPSKQEFLGILPSPGTISYFGSLLRTASIEMTEFAAPVGDREGFLFLATLGVAVVGIMVDLSAVVLRCPAFGGLPMLAIYSVPVTVTTESTSWFPFVLGALGFLWLLVTDNVDRVRRFGRRFTGDGRDVDLWEPSPLAVAGLRLGTVGVIAAVLVPLIPFAMPAGLLDRFGTGAGGGQGGNGRSVSMLALLEGQLNRDKAFEMVKVTNVNDKNPFYLRFNVLEQLTNQGFNARPITDGKPVGSDLAGPSWDSSVKTTSYKANIEVTNELAISFLPIYTWPTRIERIDNSWSFDQKTAVVYSKKQTTAKQQYTVEYLRPDITDQDLRKAGSLNPNDTALRDVLAAPANPVVKNTVAELIKGKTTQYDKVKAILDHFSPSNGFVYDLTTGPNTGGTKIAGFLENKRGYCVQYAAAFGWMLREARIPSRVAFGFARGGARQGDTMTLTNFNLHAWTEVYFPGYGWLPFDATPAASISGSVTPSYLPQANDTATDDDLPNRPGGVPETDPSANATAPGNDQGNNPGTVDSGPQTSGNNVRQTALMVLPWAGGGLLLLLLLLSPAISRNRTRSRRLAFAVAGPSMPVSYGSSGGIEVVPMPADDQSYARARSDAHKAWDELIDLMVDYNVPTDAAETPRATVERLVTEERLRDKAQESVNLLSAVEERARYARHPLTGQELRSAVGAVRTAFAERAPRRTRILAVLLPPSVLLRWRASLGTHLSTVALSGSRGREQLMRALSVRGSETRHDGRQ